ncbi:hypothetical protein AAFF_G00152060 [Aldrovandia affinis]|uniref:Uncharacterized protein n=1 Tax=Aldrovandia affinis TaxID=143900 RepID=A0AAD7W823_9TELE|nr:hypothetical protein AAFF_G00152060 [Aldrovandia affinis]
MPYTTRAKVLVQRLWDKKREWDDMQLPDDLLFAWCSWEAELEHLSKITLPRCYSRPEMDHPSSVKDIHVFCDASEQAYGSVAYLRTESPEGEVDVSFLAARSRIAPKKQQFLGHTSSILDAGMRRGKVTQVFPGANNRVRSAEVLVKDRTYTQPVARLISLPALPEGDRRPLVGTPWPFQKFELTL